MTLQAAPREEEPLVAALRSFGWALRGRRETVRRGSGGRYVELDFARDLSIPGLPALRALEERFFALEPPVKPDLFPGSPWAWLALALCGGIGVVAWLVYFATALRRRRRDADRQAERVAAARRLLRARAEACAAKAG